MLPSNVIWIEPAEERPCPLCDSEKQVALSNRMQHGLDLQTVICEGCSFVFSSPMPSRSIYERFYSEAYADYYGHISPAPLGTLAKREPSCISSKLNEIEKIQRLPGCRLLEVGPGQGLFLWWAKQRGCDVLGVEPSSQFCSVLKEAGLPYVQKAFADVTVETHGRFDVIFMSHVLEHFYDPNEALQKCRELLRENGILVVEVPNILKPFRSLERYFLRYVHPSNFSPETLKAMLLKHGFASRHQDVGEDDWRSPQSLFFVAQRTNSFSANDRIPAQGADQVRTALQKYRQDWGWKLAPLWYSRSFVITLRRKAYRFARPIKHRLEGMFSNNAPEPV